VTIRHVVALPRNFPHGSLRSPREGVIGLTFVFLLSACANTFNVVGGAPPLIYPHGAGPIEGGLLHVSLPLNSGVDLDQCSTQTGALATSKDVGGGAITLRRRFASFLSGEPLEAELENPAGVDPISAADGVMTLLTSKWSQCIIASDDRAMAAEAVAAAVPRTYEEDLELRYGLTAKKRRFVDLAPGMRLRIEMGLTIRHDSRPDTDTSKPRYQYSGATTVEYDVVEVSRTAEHELGLSTLSSRLGLVSQPLIVFDGIASGVNENVGQASGLIETLPVDPNVGVHGARKYWRLFYPKFFLPGSDNNRKILDADETVIFAIASDLPSLAAFTAAEKLTEACNDNTLHVECLSFRARGMALPLIPIRVNGETRWVEVGTTLLDVLAPVFAPQRASPILGGSGRQTTSNFAAVNAIGRFELRRHTLGGATVLLSLLPVPTSARDAGEMLRVPLAIGDEIRW
jgi:hypothetical protein